MTSSSLRGGRGLRDKTLDEGLKPGVRVGIFDDLERILLLRRISTITRPDTFEPPGGKGDGAETPKAAAEREGNEETGLILLKLRRVHKFSQDYTSVRTGKPVSVREFAYIAGDIAVPMSLARDWSGPGKIPVRLNPKEHSQFVWADQADLEGLPIDERIRAVIDAILKDRVSRA